jgi:hypothetical protein
MPHRRWAQAAKDMVHSERTLSNKEKSKRRAAPCARLISWAEVATPGATSRPGLNVRMLSFIYIVTIWCAAALLFVAVHELEPNRRLALLLEFLILALGTEAISRQLLLS